MKEREVAGSFRGATSDLPPNTTSIVTSQTSLGIGTFSTDIYSETFIRQHIESLPFRKVLLTGFELAQTAEGFNLLERGIYGRAREQVQKKLGTFQFERFRAERIARYLVQSKVNVVLAEYGTVAVKLQASCVLAGIPLIAHFHGFDAYVHEVLDKNREAYQGLFKSAAAIIAVSSAMKAQLEGLGAPPSKTHLIPYFVDPVRFLATAKSADCPVFLCVGRFVEKKAPHLSLLAFSKVLEQCGSARLKFIGDGLLLGPTMQLAKVLGIESSVEFLGSLPHDEVARQMQNATCFVQHSVKALNGDCEGTPVSVLEAQASGLPVVGTSHAGIKDVVVDGKTGLLVEELDVAGMAEAMLRIAQDPALSFKLGQAGAVRIRERFSRAETLDKLAALIETANLPRSGDRSGVHE